jgi:hypothetical protein
MTLLQRLGFRPAFLDYATMTIFPTDLAAGAVIARGTLMAGFERKGYFYTRTAAARAALDWATLRPPMRLSSPR